MSELVSILLPTKNAEKTIEKSIISVLNQTYKNFELLIIINNCSDNTESIVKNFLDSRIKVLHSNPGIVSALNMGLRESKAALIARQDSDDYWYEFKLEKQISEFYSTNVDILGTQMKICDGSNSSVTDYPLTHNECANWLLNARNPIGHPSVIFKKSILDKLGGYWDIFPFAEDMDFWFRSLPYYKIGNCNFIGMEYNHVHNPNYDSRIPQFLTYHYRNLFGVK